MADHAADLEQSLITRLKEVEEELRLLRRRLSEKQPRPARGVAQLRGLWKGKSHFSYEEIKEAEIRLKDWPS